MMRCQVCNKQRIWFVKVTRYASTLEYDPVNFEWCVSCAYKELRTAFEKESKEK